jgi:methionine aminopeptidase
MILSDPLTQLDDIENIKKYKAAGLIATKTVNKILGNAKVGCKLIDLCTIGNEFVLTECNSIYETIKHKGLSFPICLSVNEIAGYYMPESTDILKNGDILKVELGIHIDGFCAPICYTTIICDNKIDDKKKENLLRAVTETSIQIMKMMKPGKTNIDVANIMGSNANKYNCSIPLCEVDGFIPGIFSYQISRYVMNGCNDDDDEFVHSFILSKHNPNFDFTMCETVFEKDEVYAIDILMCSKNTSSNLVEFGKCNIYKRNKNSKSLKLNASKEALNKFRGEVFPISLANCDTKIKLGIKECIEKELVDTYPVVKCNKGEYLCRVMFTVIVNDNPIIISGKSASDEFNKFM